MWGKDKGKEFPTARPIPSDWRGCDSSLPHSWDGEPQQVQDPMPKPTYQGELGLGVSPWEVTELGSSMAKGQPQDQVLSTKNLLFSPSWDPGHIKRMACGKNLSNPSEEKKGPSVPHIYHFCSLESSEPWSLSSGNTDTAGGGWQGSPSKSGPHGWFSQPPGKLYSYHMILCLPFPLVDGWVGGASWFRVSLTRAFPGRVP